MTLAQAELDERARECMKAAFHAAMGEQRAVAGRDFSISEIRDALRVIYGDEAFERAKEMAQP